MRTRKVSSLSSSPIISYGKKKRVSAVLAVVTCVVDAFESAVIVWTSRWKLLWAGKMTLLGRRGQ